MFLSQKSKKQLNSLSIASLRVILAIIYMLENGQQAEVDAFMKAMEATR